MPVIQLFDPEEGKVIEVWEPEDAPVPGSQDPFTMESLKDPALEASMMQKAPGFLANLAKGTGKAILRATPEILGASLIGGPGAGISRAVQRMAGAGLGEFLAQESGLVEGGPLEIATAMIPTPIGRAARQAARYPAVAKAGFAVGRPETITGLGEEAFELTGRAAGKLKPPVPSETLFANLRADPAYRATGPKTVTVPPPTGMFGPSGLPTTQTLTTYPVQLNASRAARAAQEAEAQSLGTVSAKMEAEALSQLYDIKEASTFEGAHRAIMRMNKTLTNTNLDQNQKRLVTDLRSSLWQDLQSSALTPELQAANQAFKREAAAETLDDLRMQSYQQMGKVKVLDINQFMTRLQQRYQEDDFLRDAIPEDEFARMIDEFSGLGVEQLAAGGQVGTLATYGLMAGTAGGIATELAGTGKAAPLGIAAMLPAMQYLSKTQKEAAFGADPTKRVEMLKRFRTPLPFPGTQAANITEYTLQPAQASLAENFLRQRGVSPTGEENPEEELRRRGLLP